MPYLWDADAAAGIKRKKLDKHYQKNKTRYLDFAKTLTATLNTSAGPGVDVEEGDLYVILTPLLALDAELRKALQSEGVSDARRTRWISWFTWYVIKQTGLP